MAENTVEKPAGSVRILLTGDVMLGRGVDQVLPFHCDPVLHESCVRDARRYVKLAEEVNGPVPARRGFAYPWGVSLADIQAKQPDAFVINLETAVTTSPTPWPHKGINYRMHPGNLPTLKAARVQVASLANNHSADWGMQGLLETLEALQGAGIQTPGAGRDLAEAEAAAVLPLTATPDIGSSSSSCEFAAQGRGRLLVWAVGHHSSGIPEEWAAGPGQPGVALTKLTGGGAEQIAARVRAAKRPGDVVVVSIHWGSNWGFEVPSEQRRFAHALIDGGVDVVHGHSSHHLKGAELYRGRLVAYGCGDLISDYEGIRNSAVEAAYPHDQFRDDLGALWYADVSAADGRLRQLLLTPTRLRRLSLHDPDTADQRHLERVLARECSILGGLAPPRRTSAGSTLVLVPAGEAVQ